MEAFRHLLAGGLISRIQHIGSCDIEASTRRFSLRQHLWPKHLFVDMLERDFRDGKEGESYDLLSNSIQRCPGPGSVDFTWRGSRASRGP